MRKPLFFVAIALGMAAGPCYAQRAALPSPLLGQATACGVKAEVKSEFAASPARVQVLAERILAPGVFEQECALASGARYKRIVKRHGAAQPLRLLADLLQKNIQPENSNKGSKISIICAQNIE